MVAEVKFCGLARSEDAREGARLGARYLGAVFAGGPRAVTPLRALEVLDAAGSGVRRVGVFADVPPEEVGAIAREARLDVVQLHGSATDVSRVDAVRGHFSGLIWAVLRLNGPVLPREAGSLFRAADAVLIEGVVPGVLGGAGGRLDWAGLAAPLARVRAGAALVLAGGLTPENVAGALALLAPDVVDVSSGVERSPGVKDHARMRAFVEAVRGTGAEHGS